MLQFFKKRNNLIFIAITCLFLGGLGYTKGSDMYWFYKKQVAAMKPIPVDDAPEKLPSNDKEALQESQPELQQEPTTPEAEPAKDPNKKQWIEGRHFEWRVPEGVSGIVLKYKESNGRLILDYNFKLNPGERIEIQAQ